MMGAKGAVEIIFRGKAEELEGKVQEYEHTFNTPFQVSVTVYTRSEAVMRTTTHSREGIDKPTFILFNTWDIVPHSSVGTTKGCCSSVTCRRPSTGMWTM